MQIINSLKVRVYLILIGNIPMGHFHREATAKQKQKLRLELIHLLLLEAQSVDLRLK